MTKNPWIVPVVAGLAGAAVWPIAASLVVAMDEGRIELPQPIEALITGIWLVWSMPGAIVAGRGYLTLAVITLFWSAVCAWSAARLSGLWRRRRAFTGRSVKK